MPIPIDEFLTLNGYPLALKARGEWVNEVDDEFIAFVLENHRSLEFFHLRMAMCLFETVDRPEVRSLLSSYIGHPNIAVNHTATKIMESQTEKGWTSHEPPASKN